MTARTRRELDAIAAYDGPSGWLELMWWWADWQIEEQLEYEWRASMKRGTPDHPKVKALAQRLKIQLPHAGGILEFLWLYTARYAPRGDIGRFSDKIIAEACGWHRKPDELIAALTSDPSKFLDKSAEHRLVVHDWPDHCDDSVKKLLARKQWTFAQNVQTKDGLCPEKVRLCPENVLVSRARVPPPPPPSPPPLSGQNPDNGRTDGHPPSRNPDPETDGRTPNPRAEDTFLGTVTVTAAHLGTLTDAGITDPAEQLAVLAEFRAAGGGKPAALLDFLAGRAGQLGACAETPTTPTTNGDPELNIPPLPAEPEPAPIDPEQRAQSIGYPPGSVEWMAEALEEFCEGKAGRPDPLVALECLESWARRPSRGDPADLDELAGVLVGLQQRGIRPGRSWRWFVRVLERGGEPPEGLALIQPNGRQRARAG